MLLLDVRTLIVIFVVGNVLVGSLMLAAFHRRLTTVLRFWIGGLFLQALGWMLMSECGGPRPLLGFLLNSISYGCMLTALTLHFNVSRRYHWPWWPVVVTAVMSCLAPDSIWHRQIAANLMAAIQISLAAYIVLRQDGQRTPLRGLMGLSGVFGAATLLVRALDLYMTGSAQCLAEVGTTAMSLMFLSFFVFRFTFMFGFILLIESRQREAISRLAALDPLTEIYNRRTFIEFAGRELRHCRRTGRGVSLLVFDLDHFKQINDSHGHGAGDEVLLHVRQVMSNCLRGSDLFARYGGEEFVVLMPETSAAGAMVLAERLRAAIAAEPVNGVIPVTASMGVVSVACVDENTTLESLLDAADQAMYAAKSAGRNCVIDAATLGAENAEAANTLVPAAS